MDRVIGTCSHCGGDVVVPNVWYGINPPIPRCSACGATPRRRNMPIIDMNPPSKESMVKPWV